MKISERTIAALADIICGNNDLSFYRTGPNLIRFFNEIGFNDVYGQGFPSRPSFTEDKIRELNDTGNLVKVFEQHLDPRNFIDLSDYDPEAIVSYLNKYLKFDGYEIFKNDDLYKVKDLSGSLVELEVNFGEEKEVNQLFIEEQIKKCNQKIIDADYSGAITNARSLVEAVLKEIENKLDQDAPDYDGDLIKLYRRVQKLLNLEPSRKDVSDSLKPMLSGLNSIISGLSGVRNKMSDSHVLSYTPSKHHAKLAVNAANTFCDFIFSTLEYQKSKNLI